MVLSAPATTIQLGLLLHAAVVMTALKLSAKLSTLRARHESGLLSRQIGCEVLMKMGGVEISKPVYSLLYRSRLAEVTWKALPVVSLILSSIWHVGRDVNQSRDRGIRPASVITAPP